MAPSRAHAYTASNAAGIVPGQHRDPVASPTPYRSASAPATGRMRVRQLA